MISSLSLTNQQKDNNVADFFEKHYAGAVDDGTPYTEVWVSDDGRVMGMVQGVLHRLPTIPNGFEPFGKHYLDNSVTVYVFRPQPFQG